MGRRNREDSQGKEGWQSWWGGNQLKDRCLGHRECSEKGICK